MAGVSTQKQKLLQMEQLFERRTDESHSLTGNQLIEILAQMGIKAERKTIYDDIATLCDAGIKLETTKNGHSNAYYLAERLFTVSECDSSVRRSKSCSICKSFCFCVDTPATNYTSPLVSLPDFSDPSG